jgi:hypothetical protein
LKRVVQIAISDPDKLAFSRISIIPGLQTLVLVATGAEGTVVLELLLELGGIAHSEENFVDADVVLVFDASFEVNGCDRQKKVRRWS